MKAKVSPSPVICFFVLIFYGALLIYFACMHEMWRDEVRALSIAQSSAGIGDLFLRLRNEGHPSLWYLCLYFATMLWHSPLVMPLVSILIALIAAKLFFRFAPFPFYLKVLWLFGYYPLYEYSVVCRNYGIGMMFLFLFLTLFPQRFEKPWRIALCLSCLANTSAFAWILSGALFASLVFEYCCTGVSRSAGKRGIAAAALLVMVAHALAAFQMWPEPGTVVSHVHGAGASRIISSAWISFISHGSTFHDGFWLPFSWAPPLIILATYFLLIRTPSTLVFLFLLVFGMELFHHLIYSGVALRHQGMLVLGLFSALWMDEYKHAEVLKSKRLFIDLEKKRVQLKLLGLSLICLLQIYAGAKAIRTDILYQMSSAKEFADMVRSKPELASAIIISEPDYLAETLPYYLQNSIYFPRESAFKQYVSFTAAAKRRINLSETLEAAKEISRTHDSNIILLLPPDATQENEMELLYGRSFVIDSAGARQLQEGAELLQKFTAAKRDENYSVWLLKSARAKSAGES